MNLFVTLDYAYIEIVVFKVFGIEDVLRTDFINWILLFKVLHTEDVRKMDFINGICF